MAEIEGRKYKNAARCFLQASFEHCNCSDVSYTIDIVIANYHIYWCSTLAIYKCHIDWRSIVSTCSTSVLMHCMVCYITVLWPWERVGKVIVGSHAHSYLCGNYVWHVDVWFMRWYVVLLIDDKLVKIYLTSVTNLRPISYYYGLLHYLLHLNCYTMYIIDDCTYVYFVSVELCI